MHQDCGPAARGESRLTHELPHGQYISLVNVVKADAGGRTRALLMRNRLFVERGGVVPTIVTTDDEPSYPESRASWTASGHLVEPIRLLNLFETFRERPMDDLTPLEVSLPDLHDRPLTETHHPDGSVYCTTYELAGGAVVHDYRRSDGSVFARLNPTHDRSAWDASESAVPGVVLCNRAGRVVHRWKGRRGWVTHWIKELTPGEDPVFVICDNLAAIRQLAPVRDPRYHVLHVFHNAHLEPPRRWNSPMPPAYVAVMRLVESLDGLVLLSARQRADIATRFGATTNLMVVPNPVESTPRPDPVPARDPFRFAMVCRLAEQKRVDRAIRVFARVVEAEPRARLDIFGDGPLEAELQELIDSLGLRDHVVLRGYDTRARDTLWSAAGFLMTSEVEGYPLATLESMSHGCPVISYDIKYGPRDQITDGVDGFIVATEDAEAMAERILLLTRDPALLSRLSAAAIEAANRHDADAFLVDWRLALEAAARQRPALARITSATFVPSVGRFHRVKQGVGLKAAGRPRADRLLDGRIWVRGVGSGSVSHEVTVSLQAVHDDLDPVVSVPLTVHHEADALRVVAAADRAVVLEPFGDRSIEASLRLRLVWRNSCWQTDLDQAGRVLRTFAPSHEWAQSALTVSRAGA